MSRPTIGRPRPHNPTGPTGPTPKPQPRPQAVTPDTPFRQMPELTLAQWTDVFHQMNSPILDIESCYTAAGNYTALALAQAIRESTLGKYMQAGTMNPLGLMQSDGRTLMRFSSTANAFREYERRLSDPTYKAGVYMPWDMSLHDYLSTYVGGPLCRTSNRQTCANGETAASIGRYESSLIADVNGWLGVAAPTPTPGPTGPSPSPSPSPVVRPNIELRLIDPNLNTAWDDLGPRQIRGLVLHRMLGTLLGTDNFFRGEARTRARTDFGIGNNGHIYQWTPLESNMAPWASGPADGIKGDAVAFYDVYGKGKPIGVSVCNRDCASIEIEGNYDTPMAGADWDRLVELVAWLAAHYCGATVVSWPKNRDGIHLLLAHNEWTNDKPCPGIWVLSNVTRLIDDVRERLAS